MNVKVSSARTSHQSFAVAGLETDHLSEASPLGRYYFGVPDEMRTDNDDDVLTVDYPIPHDNAEDTGSTETIPSTWEPNESEPLNESSEFNASNLFRTQSINDPAGLPLGFGDYSHQHIYLSQYRNSNRSVEIRGK